MEIRRVPLDPFCLDDATKRMLSQLHVRMMLLQPLVLLVLDYHPLLQEARVDAETALCRFI